MPLTRRSLLAGAAAPFALRRAGAAARLNILWISCEDTSPDLGCYGDRYARTPNLDRLAAEGTRFTRAFSTYGVCAPSRSSIITGMYPASIGTHHMRSQGVPPPHVKCFTEYLRAAGYYCSNNVKTDYNFESPATAWDDCSNQAHWRNREKGQPFFSVINITTTHESQIRAPEDQFARQTRRLGAEDRHDPARATLPSYYPDTPVVRRDWANYYDLVSAMDLQVADILGQLEADGLSNNTAVFFWGDHGRGLPRAKRWVYDSGIHVPLIVRLPGQLAPGSVNRDLVSLMDLGPTAMNLAGLAVPRYMQGQPFLGAGRPPARRYIYAARDRMDETYDIIRAVRDTRWKYIRNYQACKPYAQYIDYMDQMPSMREWRRLHKEGTLTGAQRNFFAPEKPPEELYDTEADPDEVSNLAGRPEHAQTMSRLRAEHERFMKDTGDLGLMPEPELVERMRPGGKWETAAPVSAQPAGGRFTSPVKLKLSCPTPGASIAWTENQGDKPHWRLYSGEILVERSTTVRAKACRLGWHDSPEQQWSLEIG